MRNYIGDRGTGDLTSKLPIVVALIGLCFTILFLRLWYIQLYKGSYFSELSTSNRIRLLKDVAPRGLIIDRNGIIIAEDKQGFKVSMIPADISDRDKITAILTSLIEIDKEVIDEKFKEAKKRPSYLAITLKDHLSWEEMAIIENNKWRLPGIILESGPVRHYPFGEMTSHITGYMSEVSKKELKKHRDEGRVGYDIGDYIGKYAIESKLEHALKGIDGGKRLEVDAKGNEIRTVDTIKPYRGNTIRLTIDMPTQAAAWHAMTGKRGAIVAMDPKSGDILALVSTPGFDPNAITLGLSEEEWRALTGHPDKLLTNRALKGVYPPASTFKVVTAAAALETKVITKDTKIKSEGSFSFGGDTFRNWKRTGHGTINIHEALVESADTFFYPIAVQIGLTNMVKYSDEFGFGKPTGLDLGSEYSGLLPTNEWKKRRFGKPWYDGETIHLSIGQGYMLATPLQLVQAYSAIANGGSLYKPKLINKIETFEGEVLKNYLIEEKYRLSISKETFDIIRNGLRGVVAEKNGTARSLSYSEYKIAGKTGTAQVAKMKERKKLEDIPEKLRDHALFVGFAPFDNPEIVIAIIVENGGFGATSAAPLAKDIIDAFMSSEENFRPQIQSIHTREKAKKRTGVGREL